MRLHIAICTVFLIMLATVGGCPPQSADQGDNGLITAVAGISDSEPSTAAEQPATQTPVGSTTVSGSVSGQEDYRLIELGTARAGQEWTVNDESSLLGSGRFLVALFDSDYELLRRQMISPGTPLTHIIRSDTPTLYLGVTASYTGRGGDYRFEVTRQSGLSIPAPRRQVVWLNFGGASNLRVHARSGLSFAAFDASMAGREYAGATEVVKAAIVSAMHEDYALYNVAILTSDDGPPPAGPYATVHFGCDDDRLLGLADNVDQYNADPGQNAIIYVEAFSVFEVMALSAEEMGQMIGNVASHEFGHLLGLFHTQVPTDLMDTTGTAWDLAGDQSFLRAELEPSVFPFGYENSPRRLAETVGYKPGLKESDLAKPAWSPTMSRKAMLRALAREVLRDRCGTCLNLDD
jgi:hypothetical protein